MIAQADAVADDSPQVREATALAMVFAAGFEGEGLFAMSALTCATHVSMLVAWQ